jgi:hypothetical protein
VISRSNKEKKNGNNKDRRRRAGSEWNRKKKQAKGQGRILNEERKMTLCVDGKKMEGQVGG